MIVALPGLFSYFFYLRNTSSVSSNCLFKHMQDSSDETQRHARLLAELKGCDSYDLTISIKKTEVVYQPAPGKHSKEPTITVKGQLLQVLDKFTYLGSTLSRVVHIDDEVNARIAKASAAFGRLRGSIWDRSGIRLDTKLKVYR